MNIALSREAVSLSRVENPGVSIPPELFGLPIRQTVLVLLVSPSCEHLLVTRHRDSVTDGRANWSPIQGEKEKSEDIFETARRLIKQEVGLSLMVPKRPDHDGYLGSHLRPLSPSHKKYDQYVASYYHVVLAQARCHEFKIPPKSPLSDAKWIHARGLTRLWPGLNMSLEKSRIIFQGLRFAVDRGDLQHSKPWKGAVHDLIEYARLLAL